MLNNHNNHHSINFDDNDKRLKKGTTKLMIITTIDDDDHQKILSYLTPAANQSVLIDLDKPNPTEKYFTNNIPQLIESESKRSRRRKADLTCVICEGDAGGYNFDQITCESCKAFFRRNALQSIEKTKCLNLKNDRSQGRCHIQHDVKYKCQRCRLLKCFDAGMRKDYILTSEKKQLKERRLEENRRLRSTSNNNLIKTDDTIESPSRLITSFPLTLLTTTDWSCLHYIQNAYLSSLQSSPSASSMVSLTLAPDRTTAYANTVNIQHFSALKIINFVRQISEFEGLDEEDRLILVKYNLSSVSIIRCALTFDATRELCYDDNISSFVSRADEAFAHESKSLFTLCYGYHMISMFTNVVQKVFKLVDGDPYIVQLLMLIMMFEKGSSEEDFEPLLKNSQRVYRAHTKYTDLLFRYLIEKSSFTVAVTKMMHIVEVLLQIHDLKRIFHEDMRTKVDANYIDPLMKSLLHLT